MLNRASRQIDFLSEIEKLKVVYRQNGLIDGNRFENSAEHSWHSALFALILKEYCLDQTVDISRVVEMLLVHDLAEIYTGDTFLYDDKKKKHSGALEKTAAERLFGLLPADQKTRYLDLWNEFEERKTKEALYAAAMDGLQPIINHYLTGKSDGNEAIMLSRVKEKKNFIKQVAPELWDLAQEILDKCVKKGLYKEG